jgi:uncharacterized lipoprotein YddW (UPF0748 family)
MWNKKLIVLILLSIVLAAVVTYLIGNSDYFVAQVKNETRGVYFPASGSQAIYSSKGLAKAVDKMRSLNLNTIYMDTFARNHTLYPSTVNQKYTGLKNLNNRLLDNRDILKETLDLTSDKKIKTFAWFEYGFLGFANSELITKNPSWLSLNSEGKTTTKEGTIWLNPFKPEVKNYITEILLEMVKNYPTLDGIQFDDHMAFNSDLGYDSFTLELYKKETSKIAPKAPTTPDPLNDPIWKHWLDFRTNKITAFMKEIVGKIRAINPKLIISAAVNYEAYAYKSFCQKWSDWYAQGVFNEMTVQVYRNNNTNFTNTALMKENLDMAKKIPVTIGIGLIVSNESAPFQRVSEQIDIVRKNGFRGFSFWYYEFLDFGPQEKTEDRLANFKKKFPSEVAR